MSIKGRSVEEIYRDLDRLDRLDKAYEEKRAECAVLHSVIRKVIDCNLKTASTYQRVSKECETSIDSIEFLGKAFGLLEANLIIRRCLQEAARPEED